MEYHAHTWWLYARARKLKVSMKPISCQGDGIPVTGEINTPEELQWQAILPWPA
jgi:hypothetical protein